MSPDIRQPKSPPTTLRHRSGCILDADHRGPCKAQGENLGLVEPPHKAGCFLGDEHAGTCRTKRFGAYDPRTSDPLGPSPDNPWRKFVKEGGLEAEQIADQPPPRPSEGDIWALVLRDMAARRQTGISRYGTPLQPNNGRDALVDLYQELLDAVAYVRQLIEERK